MSHTTKAEFVEMVEGSIRRAMLSRLRQDYIHAVASDLWETLIGSCPDHPSVVECECFQAGLSHRSAGVTAP